MTIVWDKNLETGIAWQDDQHKELFMKINSLLHAIRTGKGREEVGRTVEFLADYVVFHFRDEEMHMEKTGYPGYAAHKKEHREFADVVFELRKEIVFKLAAKIPVPLVPVQRLLVNWVVNHIAKVDKELGEFLSTREVSFLHDAYYKSLTKEERA